MGNRLNKLRSALGTSDSYISLELMEWSNSSGRMSRAGNVMQSQLPIRIPGSKAPRIIISHNAISGQSGYFSIMYRRIFKGGTQFLWRKRQAIG
jgi:hypothetical protein